MGPGSTAHPSARRLRFDDCQLDRSLADQSQPVQHVDAHEEDRAEFAHRLRAIARDERFQGVQHLGDRVAADGGDPRTGKVGVRSQRLGDEDAFLELVDPDR